MRGLQIFSMCPELDVGGLIDGTNVSDSMVMSLYVNLIVCICVCHCAQPFQLFQDSVSRLDTHS